MPLLEHTTLLILVHQNLGEIIKRLGIGPTSKSYNVALKVVQKADHSRNPSSFSDYKQFVYSTCQKCVFNANHDACVTKVMKAVNSRAKFQSPKTSNNNKPVKQNSHTQKPVRKIFTGHRFSPRRNVVFIDRKIQRSLVTVPAVDPGFLEKFGGGFEHDIDEQVKKKKRSGEDDEESKICCGLNNGEDEERWKSMALSEKGARSGLYKQRNASLKL
ncbi:hypothetical protein Tco_0584042 [Tanacetum coccineum]